MYCTESWPGYILTHLSADMEIPVQVLHTMLISELEKWKNSTTQPPWTLYFKTRFREKNLYMNVTPTETLCRVQWTKGSAHQTKTQFWIFLQKLQIRKTNWTFSQNISKYYNKNYVSKYYNKNYHFSSVKWKIILWTWKSCWWHNKFINQQTTRIVSYNVLVNELKMISGTPMGLFWVQWWWAS